MSAFSCVPREYIRPDGTRGMRSVHGWYARTDNNGWRPVAERVLLDEDPITTITRMKRTPLFHYNPAVRRWGALCRTMGIARSNATQMPCMLACTLNAYRDATRAPCVLVLSTPTAMPLECCACSYFQCSYHTCLCSMKRGSLLSEGYFL